MQDWFDIVYWNIMKWFQDKLLSIFLSITNIPKMRSLAECDNLWLVMHDLSLLKTSKHLLQHGSPSAALVVWPPFFQTHPPQSASSSGFLACQNPENRMIDSSRQQARWKGSAALCVGKTQETEDHVQSQKAALQGTFNTRLHSLRTWSENWELHNQITQPKRSWPSLNSLLLLFSDKRF